MALSCGSSSCFRYSCARGAVLQISHWWCDWSSVAIIPSICKSAIKKCIFRILRFQIFFTSAYNYQFHWCSIFYAILYNECYCYKKKKKMVTNHHLFYDLFHQCILSGTVHCINITPYLDWFAMANTMAENRLKGDTMWVNNTTFQTTTITINQPSANCRLLH